jgi:hypothetical protein
LRIDGEIAYRGAVNGSIVSAVDEIVTSAFSIRSDQRVCVIEDQQQFAARSYKSTRTLIRRAEIWAVLCERIGVRVERVPVRTWQGHLKLRGDHDQRMAGLRRFLRALAYDVDTMTDDECCACGIDLWAHATIGGEP